MDRVFANIALVGMMGAGKSTVARLVAESLGWDVRDTDAEIAARAGMDIAVIFATLGEPAFREMEREAVETASLGERAVIATGGGAMLREDNREALFGRCFVVWLSASPEECFRRASTGETRPLLQQPNAADAVRRLLAERERWYSLAHVRVDTDGREPAVVAAEIVALWRARAGR